MLRDKLKQALMIKYAKHLGVGENWTEQELIESDFSGAILGGFGKSAWKMYEIAKQRIEYQGWPLSVDDIPIEAYDDNNGFEFDGTRYASVQSCIDYFSKAAGINKELMTELVEIVSPVRFGYALRIAKINKRASHSLRMQIIDEVLRQEADQQEIQQEKQPLELAPAQGLQEVVISGTVAPIFAIQWALSNKIKNFDHLCSLEDDYFDDFEYLGGTAAFLSYNGLQLYLESRENSEWVEQHDPNKEYWSIIHTQ